MAKVEVISGGRVIENVVIGTPQPMSPTGALPPDIGFVQISTSDDRGSIWTTGEGPPTGGAGQAGDMYLDMDTGDVYRWDGTAWILQGTFAPSTDTPEEVLAKIIQVDGEGSGLDADTLDGHDSTYFATEAARAATQGEVDVLEARVDSVESTNTQQSIDIDAVEAVNTTQNSRLDAIEADTTDWTEITGKPATFPPTLPIPSSGVTGLDAKQASQDAAIALRLTDAPSDGLVYGRKNANWSTVIGGAHTDDLPPPAPLQDGQLWWKSSTGAMFIWYDDGNSQQWVQVAGTLESPYPLVRATAQARNRIVNPAMQISQENGDTAVVTANYPADQWVVLSSIASVGFGRGRPSASGSDYIGDNVSTPKPSLAAGDYHLFRQNIEGTRVKDFRYGTASAKQSVLRFSAWATTGGTFAVAVKNSTINRTFLAPFTLPSGAWTDFAIVIPGDTTGTWLTTTGIGLTLEFNFAAGSTLGDGVAGWQAGNKHGFTGMSNGAAVGGQHLIADVGLYLDPDNTGLPPQWQMPDEAEELAACQRYWYADYFGMNGDTTRVTALTWRVSYGSQMRIIPALSQNGTSTTNCTFNALDTATNKSARVYLASVTAGAWACQGTYYANARL